MIQDHIKQKLDEAFKPVYLDVINESHRHRAPAGSESHFKIVMVSHQFSGLKALERHRMVYNTLEEEFNHGGVHALALHLYTLKEWEEALQVEPISPPCVSRKDK
ncbi:BolA family transcriptional regulator [Candidatus Williamhamiltonella defendens]|uniref:DNA-binding transcriptional regulator BolA n=2 Tax=Candidatus Williamhamiltonella defendens TaxID=138072 RepID=A0A2D3T0H8_9ENTR|nr:BolA/IbaG family iron-sulfur metabolism protein [Candidatus Hamiltonella defensa]ACQ66832.1 transcriptional activator of morphogenic pathway (BolA family) [Candidatus Hamiltonella defensa 5AT (Acyrthosiphon pisum)]ASV32826.1 BolA family transcriptional regulator [Candidatus Hamiltonella defensa]ATW21642.1 BolA family transcriptional regulator [Candidatus Hamiltonella defensa]ATW29031.1 BolA family transcriptional regulator [Candidatus Hamiltonella defensa]ATW30998.1 BolA family transcriptio